MKMRNPAPSPLLPLIKLAAKTHGLKSDVLVQVIKKGGTANWGQISDWLHPDESKRRLPRAAALKIMLAVQKEKLAQAKRK